jgi:uncharacterized lipoprotein NlpE involved in copper resistance
MSTDKPNDITLMGCAFEDDDGTWCVECVFEGFTERADAIAVSLWLHDLIEKHLCEINPGARFTSGRHSRH